MPVVAVVVVAMATLRVLMIEYPVPLAPLLLLLGLPKYRCYLLHAELVD